MQIVKYAFFAIVGLVVFGLGFTVAYAHTTVQVDPYEIEAGWQDEPPVVGILNAITFDVREPGDVEGVSTGVLNAFKKLEVTVEKDNQTKNYEESISIMDGLFDKLSETSGMDAFLDSVDELFSEMDSEEINVEEVKIKSNAVIELFNNEVSWRSAAKQDLMPKLQEYNLAIKETIGLRLQSKLTKEQAIYVSRCNSVHRDISLNF